MIELLSNTGFIMYNKSLARLLGVNAAILVGELCSKYQYWLEEGSLLENDGWFYITQRDVHEDTGLTPYQQRNAVQVLKDEGILETKLSGNPAKLFFHISEIMLNNLLSINFTTRCQETSQLYIRNTKKDNKIMSEVKPQTFSEDSEELKLSHYLFSKMQGNNPNVKEPNFQQWSKEFKLILQNDHRELDDVRNMIDFTQWDDFWKTNILSPHKLRKQYDQLILVRERHRKEKCRSG